MTIQAATHLSAALPESLAEAMEFCRRVCRSQARNFYYGLKLSPEPHRSALYVLYAWMRHADDLADSATPHDSDSPADRISLFRRQTVAALDGSPLTIEPLWTALAATADRFDLPHRPFHDMLDGQMADVAKRSYETFEELRTYCQQVASTVGLLCIEIWGYKSDRARDLAVERGIAFQLTNILRDYAQDFDNGRIYLPREDFQRFSVSPEDLRHWNSPSHCASMMQFQIERAEEAYAQSAELDELIAPPFQPTLWAMTEIYHALLRKISRDPAQVVKKRRVRLSTIQKTSIALRARWGTSPTQAAAVKASVVPVSHGSGGRAASS